MTVDLVIRGGTVVDGTGAPARRADVAVVGGRIVKVGTVDEPTIDEAAGRVIDAEGRVVSPGFIDIHTHYDAQALWDPAMTPSPLHGVTSVIGGNCGFSLAPLGAEHAGYVMRMMSRVEGMPLETLEAGPAWDWSGFGEWLDRLEGRLGLNAGFFAGHSTIRRVVMGDDAHEPATRAQVEEMVELLHAALAAGAIGFSSSLGEAHTDYEGRPVPSRRASHEELLALAGAVARHEGTSLGFIAAMGEIPAERIELMTAMSLAAGRPLNFNLLGSLSPTEVYEQQLTACDHARTRGATVLALALPDLLSMRMDLLGGLPEWADVLAMGPAQRRAACADEAVRDRLRTAARDLPQRLGSWDLLTVGEGPCAGRSIAALAAEWGTDPEDALIDAVVPDRQPVAMLFPSLTPTLGASAEGWAVRRRVWNDDRVLLGGSDAGAHMDLMCHANYPTVVLGEMTRERGIFSLPQAVRLMTDVPARLYGLRHRGRIAEGWFADITVFDPETVGSKPVTARADLPAGATRLYAEATGVDDVVVNGEAVAVRGQLTGALAGTVLRSGRDTETVTVPGATAHRGG